MTYLNDGSILVADSQDLYIGVDIGTSGVRAVCVDNDMHVQTMASIEFQNVTGSRADPASWGKAVASVLSELIDNVPKEQIKAIAIDGTSGTMVVVDDQAQPLSQALMYNDTCNDQAILSLIEKHAPETSAAHGASSGLAKAIQLSKISGASCIQHEADWVASSLSGKPGLSDENNSLKTGYDPITQSWPDWIEQTGMDKSLLPKVLRAGQPIGMAHGWLAKQVGLSRNTLVVAGTTDGCASFLATGAAEPGDAVTVLGSTLTIKLLSETPVYAPSFGIYSHKIGDTWLAGGASNTGGKVLAHYFTPTELNEYSDNMTTSAVSGLDYYPLLKPGERFPINDSNLQPRLEPRPESDVLFLQAMLEGIAAVEKLAYTRLTELGGSQLRSIRTVGGGATNDAWTIIRKSQLLNIPFKKSLSEHAATGTAVLAKRGVVEAGLLDTGLSN